MADFYPVLKKAIDALPAGASRETRNALYDKARAALLRQLQARDPLPSEGDIMRQRLALEEVVRRIEQEADDEALTALEDLGQAAAPTPYAPVQPSRPPQMALRMNGPMIGMAAAVLLAVVGGGYLAFGGRSAVPGVEPAATPPANVVAETRSLEKPAQSAAQPVPSSPAIAPEPNAAPAPSLTPAQAANPVQQQAAAPQAAQNPPVEPPTPPQSGPEEAAPTQNPTTSSAEQAASPAPAPAAQGEKIAIAVRASIYEPPAEQGGRATERRGALIWRTVPASEANPAPAINGIFEFPDLRLNATMLLQKNTDTALPATHNLSLLFTPLPGNTIGIREVLSVELRDNLQKLGTRLDGVRAQPLENMVLIGLSAAPASAAKNEAALRDLPWLYVDLVFTDGRRGALIFEKGAAGNKVFADAFKAWGS
jgi:hypothetical protein